VLRPTPDPSQEGSRRSDRVLSVPLLGGVRGGFIVPKHAKNGEGAFRAPMGSETSGLQREEFNLEKADGTAFVHSTLFRFAYLAYLAGRTAVFRFNDDLRKELGSRVASLS